MAETQPTQTGGTDFPGWPLFRPHPWHGISIGPHAPALVTCYVEIVPFDTVKYEIDKESGYLRIDRPQRYSHVCPTPYGFLPRTLCGPRVAERLAARSGSKARGRWRSPGCVSSRSAT